MHCSIIEEVEKMVFDHLIGAPGITSAFEGAVILMTGSIMLEDNHGLGTDTWLTGGAF